MSKAQIKFAESVQRIIANRSTGSDALDELGSKVLYGINEGKVKFVETMNGFEGQMGKAVVSISKVTKGKVKRTILDVSGFEIQGEFAARAYKMANSSLNKKGRKTIQVDEEQVNDVMALLD